MAKIYYDSDCDLNLLKGKVIGIIGYGSQGHAQAQNLRDSGCQVIVAEAKGRPAWKQAQSNGFEVKKRFLLTRQVLMMCKFRVFKALRFFDNERYNAKDIVLLVDSFFGLFY